MAKNRCAVKECNKKLKLSEEFLCKCLLFFCMTHRYKDMHNCTYDYAKEWKDQIIKNNPLVSGDKLQDRI